MSPRAAHPARQASLVGVMVVVSTGRNGDLHKWLNYRFLTLFSTPDFGCCKLAFFVLGDVPGSAIAPFLKDGFVGLVPKSLDRSSSQESVWEGLAPLGQVQVDDDDGGSALMALRDEVVEILARGV